MRNIKGPTDFFAGLFLMGAALLALMLSWPLASASSVGLGPGYVPKLLGFLLLGLGAAIALGGLFTPGETAEPWALRPLILVLAGIAFFALAIERLGLVVALTGLVLLVCAAHRDTTLREALLLAAGSSVFSYLVFVRLLGLSMTLWPAFG